MNGVFTKKEITSIQMDVIIKSLMRFNIKLLIMK